GGILSCVLVPMGVGALSYRVVVPPPDAIHAASGSCASTCASRDEPCFGTCVAANDDCKHSCLARVSECLAKCDELKVAAPGQLRFAYSAGEGAPDWTAIEGAIA